MIHLRSSHTQLMNILLQISIRLFQHLVFPPMLLYQMLFIEGNLPVSLQIIPNKMLTASTDLLLPKY